MNLVTHTHLHTFYLPWPSPPHSASCWLIPAGTATAADHCCYWLLLMAVLPPPSPTPPSLGDPPRSTSCWWWGTAPRAAPSMQPCRSGRSSCSSYTPWCATSCPEAAGRGQVQGRAQTGGGGRGAVVAVAGGKARAAGGRQAVSGCSTQLAAGCTAAQVALARGAGPPAAAEGVP
jgi:hypothetical protein